MALVNLGAILNPKAIIVSGGLGKALGGLFLDSWRQMAANNLPFLPEIRLSELDDQETMLGAIGIAKAFVDESPFLTEPPPHNS